MTSISRVNELSSSGLVEAGGSTPVRTLIHEPSRRPERQPGDVILKLKGGEIDAEKLFWELVEPLYADPTVIRSTMMGFPCVRVDGKFFASLDRRNGHLVVKLPAGRVTELVESCRGLAFPDEAEWRSLFEEAKQFITGLG